MAKAADHRNLGQNKVVELRPTELRATEALACALAARFYGNPERVRRTQVYSERIGEALRMDAGELQSLKVASLLYDIGLLGVPEAILSKEGGLSSEEFERIKTHVTLGAELVEQMGLPSPAADIVRTHHERWNGSGYPYSLTGTAIPLGARILAVVDCFCALVVKSSVLEAVTFIGTQSGISFDPDVVGVVLDRWCEFESLLDKTGKPDALSIMEQAKRETQELMRLYQGLGSSLDVKETLGTLARDLKRLVDYDGMVVYVDRGDRLVPEYVLTDTFLLSDSALNLGEGLCVSVADSGFPILNGDPTANEAYPHHDYRSLLAVPLRGGQSLIGVLGLFRREPSSFREDELRILMEIAPRTASAIENAVRHQVATSSATTDYMTGLANSRALFDRMDDELARCRRNGDSMTVLVCDLDGFKQVNDRFGHLAGNQVLRTVARVLELNCREYDFVARMGGDEFVMILPGLPASAVDFKREQLCRVVEEAADLACAGCGVTMSVGQARSTEDGTDAEALLASADSRMYKAKHRTARRRLTAAGYETAWPSARVH